MTLPRLFMALLGLNGAFALLLGLNSLANFEGAMASFDIVYHPSMAPLGTVTAAQFLLQGALLLLAIPWTSRHNPAGATVGVAVGVYLLFLTAVEVAYGRGAVALLADAPRGALLVLCGLAVARRDGTAGA